MIGALCTAAVLHVALALGILVYELGTLNWAQLRFPVAEEDPKQMMRAAQFSEFGNSSVVKLATIPRPKCCTAGQVLVRISTGSLNPADFKQRRNPAPGMLRPLPSVSGFDISGVVEEVGPGVDSLARFDVVFGMLPLLGQRWGAFAEYVVADQAVLAKVPKSIPASEAAALPLVGLTVVQALEPVLRMWRKAGMGPEGKRILVQAGAGGVGTFAIQYCRHVLGMHVTTTASASKKVLVERLGADEVIDYRATRFEDVVKDQDVVLDAVTHEYEARTLQSPAVLRRGGHYVNVLSSDWLPNSRESNILALLLPFMKKWRYNVLARLGIGLFYHCDPVRPSSSGLAEIAKWVDEGKIRPVIDRVFPLAEADRAHSYLETGRASGKVLVQVADPAA